MNYYNMNYIISVLSVFLFCIICHDVKAEGVPRTCNPRLGTIGVYISSPSLCVEGRHDTPLQCCSIEHASFERHEEVVCSEEMGEKCVEVINRFQACGNPANSFSVDDEDNVYFWAGQWQLVSLTKNGEFRWRYEFCDPIYDSVCRWDLDDGEFVCPRHLLTSPALTMDYWGNVYFFMGDIMFAVNKDGHLILRRRVEIPGVSEDVSRDVRLYISNGHRPTMTNALSLGGNFPMLIEDGSLLVDYNRRGRNVESLYGWLILSREGDVIERLHESIHSHKEVSMRSRSVMGLNEDVFSFGNVIYEGDEIRQRTVLMDYFRGEERTFVIPHTYYYGYVGCNYGVCREYMAADNRIISHPAIDSKGRVWFYLSDGVGAYDPISRELKHVIRFNYYMHTYHTNGIVIDEHDVGYLVKEDKLRFVPETWAIDLDALWAKPQVVPENYYELGLNGGVPGVKYIYQGSFGIGGWTTPLIGSQGTLYTSAGGLHAIRKDTGEFLWKMGFSSLATMPVMLSNGHIVFSQPTTGYVWIVRERDEARRGSGVARGAWPMPFHDKYYSNNASHPSKWDHSQPPPYPNIQGVIQEIDLDMYRYEKEPVSELDGDPMDMEGLDISDMSESPMDMFDGMTPDMPLEVMEMGNDMGSIERSMLSGHGCQCASMSRDASHHSNIFILIVMTLGASLGRRLTRREVV